ncbi:hypothetical protein F5Y03DRAFT_400520 [Xylaria venustula]|nr:hypothetical protein F5Y03DRAFT_400520 [Xylaria venustula]
MQDFDVDAVSCLKQSLGKGFITNANANHDLAAHQSVITMVHAKHNLSVNIEFRNWKWTHDSIDKPDFISRQLGKHALVVFLLATVYESPRNTLSIQEFYDKIQLIAMRHGHMRVYPNVQEMQQDHFKIGDIRALDIIAQHSPKSCGKNGVKVVIIEEARNKVGCHNLKRRQTGIRPGFKTAQVGPCNPLLLHQKYIATLQDFGEFRVFLQAPPHPMGPAKIIAIALTKLEALRGRMVARHILLENFSWAGKNEKLWKEKKIELRDFACHIYTQLRARLDANEVYESLKIEVRLNISISVLDPSGQFFVNEITRWHSADFFSMDILRYPYLKICKRYSAAWSAFLRKL